MWVSNHGMDKFKDIQGVSMKDLVVKGRKIIPSHFFVYPFYTECLEEHRAEPGYDFYGKWQQWIDSGRIFVLKEQPKAKEDDLLI